jgi:hypothetical protein
MPKDPKNPDDWTNSRGGNPWLIDQTMNKVLESGRSTRQCQCEDLEAIMCMDSIVGADAPEVSILA